VNSLENVREDRTDHEVDLVPFEKSLDFRHGSVWLQFVVNHDDVDVSASHLAAEVLHGERETVTHLLAKRCGRPGQCNDHAEPDLVLAERWIQRSGGSHQSQARQFDPFDHYHPQLSELVCWSQAKFILMKAPAASNGEISIMVRRANPAGQSNECMQGAHQLLEV
jgi:hypothetical protein